ncbi:MAG TPA: hypothetical protein VD947_02625, partial [Patescibacteria group bacterium]|nr:hypothetical protein [Patescibacteria group bacterium]
FTHLNPLNVTGGTTFCGYFSSTHGYGWVGPGGESDILGQQNRGPFSDCEEIYDRPYLSIYGGDAIAGSGFMSGDTCNAVGGDSLIRTYRSTFSEKSGSGVQLAAMALGQITGFASARNQPGISYGNAHRLTFANTGGININGTETPNDGGNLGDDNLCATDFFSNKNADAVEASPPGPIPVSAIPSGQFSVNGDLTLNNPSDGFFNGNTTIYVEGDVIITGNVKYNLGKNLKLIVKGNIYIDNSVARLDGLYVAQPNGGSKGNIYTCAEGKVPYDDPQLYDNCRATPLVVNGAFIAKSVKLLRTYSSLRHSLTGEYPGINGSGTNAAEIFNFSPELYLFSAGEDDDPDDPDDPQEPYKYITTLPPIL